MGKNLIRHLPNLFTTLNLACGFTSIILIIENNIILACYLVLLAAVFDFFDGFFARLLNASSDIGKQLDSLADILSFGVVPALLMYNLLRISIQDIDDSFSFESLTFFEWIILFSPFLIATASAFRLAKFNIDPTQHYTFRGLPTPASAIFISSFVMNVLNHQKLYDQVIFTNKYFLLIVIIIISFLLVSRLHVFALKFPDFSFRENRIRYVFIGISVILVIVLQFAALPLIIALYILISLINTFL
jgi:CDP-diacylglycerol--serine O-phosphatidyltransferase